MRYFTLILFIYAANIQGYAQLFIANTGLGVDLDNGTTNYANCTTTGNKSNIQFNVSGLSVLSANNALASVNITLDASCGANLRDVALYIKSPSGTCMRIYDGSGLGTTFSGPVNFSMRDGSCLSTPNSSSLPSSAASGTTVTSNYGVFDANASSDMSVVFNGESPNGTWTIYAFEGSSNAPCITAASIFFGNSVVGSFTAATDGDNCSSALVWTGGAICATTNGHNISTQMPGSSGGGVFGSIGGIACSWNGSNDNDTWVRFTPGGNGNTCINISGLGQNLQTIVVTDANADGDNNPCTGTRPSGGANDTRWTLVSCPRPNIYTTTAGTDDNQQHCFNVVAGSNYYLVIDGNGGAETPFYISGFLPCVNITPTISGPNELCAGATATLTASSGFQSYSWSTGASAQSITINSIGTYTVTVTDNNGCTGTTSKTITTGATPTITATSNSPVCIGQSVQLNATGGASYTWSGPSGYTAIGANPDRDNMQTALAGTYTVNAIATNGCTASANVLVNVTSCLEICGNGLDDDQDGNVDTADSDCPCRE